MFLSQPILFKREGSIETAFRVPIVQQKRAGCSVFVHAPAASLVGLHQHRFLHHPDAVTMQAVIINYDGINDAVLGRMKVSEKP